MKERFTADDLERVVKVVNQCGGNLFRAAVKLKCSHVTLSHFLKKHGVIRTVTWTIPRPVVVVVEKKI